MSEDALKIEKFSSRWVNAATDLEKSAGDVGWSRIQFEKELLLPVSRFFVLTVGRALAGYGGYWKVGDEAQITNLVIAMQNRRHGLGTQLIRFLLQNAEREGCRRCILEVRASNQAAQMLYRKAGFRDMGRRPGFYTNPTDDAILMEKAL